MNDGAKNKVTGLRAKSMVTHYVGKDPKSVITGNTAKKSGIRLHSSGTGKKMLRAKSMK